MCIRDNAETADTQRLKTLLQWLSAHYTEELRVADAAGVCSFSASPVSYTHLDVYKRQGRSCFQNKRS